MANADYDYDCPSGECADKYKSIGSMNIYSCLAKIKTEMSQLGFSIISFINLDANEYLQAISLLKSLTKSVKRALVLVYVAGHGHNYLSNDYLIPANSQLCFHNNAHRYYLKESTRCSLYSLMRLFEPTDYNDPEQRDKFTVGVLWDLCRTNA